MVLESTTICVDKSQFIRNGNFNPTRLPSSAGCFHLNFFCYLKFSGHHKPNQALQDQVQRCPDDLVGPVRLSDPHYRHREDLGQVASGYSGC